MTLIPEKVKQAVGLLREFGLDCWITFTRESEICGDPTLVFLAPGHVTWHSAFIVCADGRTRAIVGLVRSEGHRGDRRLRRGRRIRDRHQGAAPRLPRGVRPPDDRRQLLRGERDLRRLDPRHVPDPPRVPRRDRTGRAAGLRREDRLGAPRAEVGGRDRLDEAGRPGDRGDLRPRRRLRLPGPDGERDRGVHPGRGRAPQAPHGLGPSHLPGRLHRARHGPGPLLADGPDRRARPRPQHGLRRQGRGLLLGHAEDLLHPRPRRDGRSRRTS